MECSFGGIVLEAPCLPLPWWSSAVRPSSPASWEALVCRTSVCGAALHCLSLVLLGRVVVSVVLVVFLVPAPCSSRHRWSSSVRTSSLASAFVAFPLWISSETIFACGGHLPVSWLLLSRWASGIAACASCVRAFRDVGVGVFRVLLFRLVVVLASGGLFPRCDWFVCVGLCMLGLPLKFSCCEVRLWVGYALVIVLFSLRLLCVLSIECT